MDSPALARFLQATAARVEAVARVEHPPSLLHAPRVNPFARAVGAAVPDSAELARILALPTRPAELPAPEIVQAFSALFVRPGSAFALWPIQVWALCEMAECGGLFGPISVGEGKTVVSYLAPTMLRAKRPLLLIPAHLREKTRRDFDELSSSLLGPKPGTYRIESYQRLAMASQADALELYAPDLIVCDEAQSLKNTASACTRRLKRYLESEDGPGKSARFVALSGTITKRSLMDYVHLLRWSLRALSPIPRHAQDASPWAGAVDEQAAGGRRIYPGALVKLGTQAERDLLGTAFLPLEKQLATVREVYRRRLTSTRGVVSTVHQSLAVGLHVREWQISAPVECLQAWKDLRETWTLPPAGGFPGVECMDGIAIGRAARELSLGFFYRWKIPGPREWMDARRAWAGYVRKILTHSQTWDTEFQVVQALDKGLHIPHAAEGREVLATWRAIRETFTPEPMAEWLSDAPALACAAWGAESPGVLWTEHTAFAERLLGLSGLPYYGPEGLDARTGQNILDADPTRSMILSRPANMTGRNLQAWSRNLWTALPPTGQIAEQVIGRTHRQGQRAELVTVDVLSACWEHARGVEKIRGDARYIEGTGGGLQKLNRATVDYPDVCEVEERVGARWHRVASGAE